MARAAPPPDQAATHPAALPLNAPGFALPAASKRKRIDALAESGPDNDDA